MNKGWFKYHAKTSTTCLIAILICVSNAFAALPDKAVIAAHFETRERLQQAIAEELASEHQKGTFSGNILITVKGQTLHKQSYGWANEQLTLKNSDNTISDIGSIAKTFTAMATLRLIAENKLSLDTTLAELFPDTPVDKASITIQQLLTHESRMGNFHADSDFEDMTKQQAMKAIFELPLLMTNKKINYSNAAYTLLAAIVEQVSSMPFQAYVKSHFLAPLKLNNTGFYGDKHLPTVRLAKGYGGDDSGETTFDKGLTWALIGGGGMVATAEDLHLWLEAILNGQVLPDHSRHQALTIANAKWTLGSLRHFDSLVPDALYMGGSTDFGYTAAIIHLPDYDANIVAILNAYNEKYEHATHQTLTMHYIVPLLLKGEQVIKQLSTP